MSQTLSAASLADLSTGNAKLLIIPQVDVLTSTSYASADELFTTKDSFSFKEGTPTETDIQLDQGNGDIIKTLLTETKSQIKGSLPYMAAELFNLIYTQITGTGSAVNGLTSMTVGDKTYNSHKAYSFDKKVYNCTIGIQSQSEETFISIMHAALYGMLNIENVSTKLWTIDFIANVQSFAGGDIVVHKQIATT